MAKILHVDDNEAHRYTVEKLLKRAGYQVEQACTGNDALELSKQKPSLIILDVNLPDISGFAVCRALKSNPETSSIPVLHLSASRTLARDKTQGLDLGADAYLAQPVDSGEFLATVKALLRIRESEEKAVRLANEWKTTFNAISDGVCIVDEKAMITRCNSAFSDLINFPEEKILGRSLAELLQEVFGTMDNLDFLEGSTTGSRRTTEVNFNRIWVRVGTDPIGNAVGDKVGFVYSFRDCTELKKAELERTTYITNLSRSNEELNQFANIASHDLKEPLRTISSYVKLLSRKYQGNIDAEADDYIRFAVQGTKRMNALIDDLLAYSRVGHQEVDRKLVDLNQILKDAQANLQEAIKDSGALLNFSPLPTLKGDPIKLSQLFQNLIGNAIKFRGKLPPEISISARQVDSEWLFNVQDNGIGIASDNISQIFIIFRRLHSREEYPGTGIGLAICKKIVEQHGGRLWVESVVSQGSSFFFTLSA